MLKVEDMINDCKKIMKKAIVAKGTDINNQAALMLYLYPYFL